MKLIGRDSDSAHLKLNDVKMELMVGTFLKRYVFFENVTNCVLLRKRENCNGFGDTVFKNKCKSASYLLKTLRTVFY